MKQHQYQIDLQWTGNRGEGTRTYRAYDREYQIHAPGKGAPIAGSSDPSFRGKAAHYNPEELLVAALSSCHMLWYLHLCSVRGVEVVAYEDRAAGTMQEEEKTGSGRFTEVCLYPRVTITRADQVALAEQLHAEASQHCFIANSCNFPIRHAPSTTVVGTV